MKRKIKLPLRLRDEEDYRIIRVTIDLDTVAEWCLDLCLLQNDLIDALVMSDEKVSYKIAIVSDTRLSFSDIGRVTWDVDGAEIALSESQLAFWVHFFLKYYRDGVADVDHIDVDIRPRSAKPGLALILEATHTRPPMTVKEVRKRLGMT